MKQTDFIAKIKDAAVEQMKKSDILASLTIAQAILESGWGEHAPGFNLFGIKANGWKGKTQTFSTREYVNGKYVTVNGLFRTYNSWDESIADHTAFLTSDKRYQNLIGQKDYKTACCLVGSDGYASSPTYAQSLIKLIEDYRLYQYDTAEKENSTVNPQYSSYLVQSGDCLSKIGAKTGCRWQDIANLNNITAPYTIRIGQVLRIPGAEASTTYTVQKGDCLSRIAAKYGTTYQKLAQKNGINPPYTIYVGQKIKIN
ncbi:MAG TPA: glucosaminidase domain-containing protein [Ruminiclostridium sp.]|nr:glucosaminidase domain-containing protein [Ruminiclostridium sp.]